MNKEKLGLPWDGQDLWAAVEAAGCDGRSQDEIEFIVLAVNNHHALVEALEDALKCHDWRVDLPDDRKREYYKLIEGAGND